jgi:hypothetical protein
MLTEEKIQHHIKHLEDKHADLQRRIDARPADYIEKVLKKEKLQLKYDIELMQLKLKRLKDEV